PVSVSPPRQPAVAPPVPKPPPVAAPPRFPVRQINVRTEEVVVAQVFKFPQVALEHADAGQESSKLVRAYKAAPAGRDVTVGVIASRSDLCGLPTRQGPSARISGKSASNLASWAARLKSLKPDELSPHFAGEEAWLQPARVPALTQVLTAGPVT